MEDVNVNPTLVQILITKINVLDVLLWIQTHKPMDLQDANVNQITSMIFQINL